MIPVAKQLVRGMIIRVFSLENHLTLEQHKEMLRYTVKHCLSSDPCVVFSRRFTALKQYSDELNTVISQLLRVRAVSFGICKTHTLPYTYI